MKENIKKIFGTKKRLLTIPLLALLVIGIVGGMSIYSNLYQASVVQ